jgi:hypothetical protein
LGKVRRVGVAGRGRSCILVCMGTGVFRHRGKDRQAATYWRRRFVALVVGLAVLALIAWAVSGALNGSAMRLAATGASPGDRAGGQAGRGWLVAGRGAASAGALSKSARPSDPATDGSAHGPAHSPAVPASPAPGSAASPGPAPGGAGQSGTCRPGGVVLSLSSSQGSFGARQLPVFDLNVVSTSARTCTFNIGAKYLTLVIWEGRTRIWGSADCVEGQGSLVTDLRRGVPTVLPVSWDRETSSPGCEIAPAYVRAGTYTATVIAGADVGTTETFRLR